MENVRRRLVVLVTFALISLTATIQFTFGAWHQQGREIAVVGVAVATGMGPMLLAAHALKVLLLPLAVDLYRRRYRLGAALAASLYFALATISVGSTLGALSVQRHQRVATEAATLKREGDLRAELAALRDRLKDIGWRRVVAEVQADIAAQHRDARWTITGDCKQPSARLQRDYCARIDRLGGELLAAKEADEARSRERDILEELRALPITSEVRHPDIELIADTFNLAADRAAFWRTLLIAVTLEAAEALPLWFATLLLQPGGPLADTATPPTFMRRTRAWTARALRRGNPAPPAASGEGAVSDSGTGAQRPKETAARHHSNDSSRPPRSARRAAHPNDIGKQVRANEAVALFVGLLLRDAEARETGRALYLAYVRVYAHRGWPHIPASIFGALLKSAIERVGGQKVKSSCQFYKGVKLPPAL